MSPPDQPFQRDTEAPPFAEPWEAQAFALTLQLYEAGHFTWREWADTLAAVLKDADAKISPTMAAITTATGWLRSKS